MSDDIARKKPTEEQVARMRAAIRAATGSWDSDYAEEFQAYIYERRKKSPRRYVIWDEDGPRFVRTKWGSLEEEDSPEHGPKE